MKKLKLFCLNAFALITLTVATVSCTEKEPDYSNFFKHTINESFSLEVPKYLEEQNLNISASNQKYSDKMLLARVVYQQKGINAKFEKGENILPIPNTLDINLISGTSKDFNIEGINQLSSSELENKNNYLNEMMMQQSKSVNGDSHVDISQKLKVDKTYEGTYYFSKSFKVNQSPLTLVIIPLDKNMLNISYSCSEEHSKDFETSIKSLKLISNQ